MHSICPASDQLVGVLWESTLPSRPQDSDLCSFLCAPFQFYSVYTLHVWHLFLHAAGHWQWVSSVSSSRRHCSDQAQKRSQPLPLVAWHFWHLQHLWPSADTHGCGTHPAPQPPPAETARINGLQFCHSLRQFVCQRAAFDQLIRKQSWRVIFFIHCCNWLALLLLMPPYFYAMVAIAFYSLFVHYQLNGKTTSKLRT